jgi:hypothetical protein
MLSATPTRMVAQTPGSSSTAACASNATKPRLRSMATGSTDAAAAPVTLTPGQKAATRPALCPV